MLTRVPQVHKLPHPDITTYTQEEVHSLSGTSTPHPPPSRILHQPSLSSPMPTSPLLSPPHTGLPGALHRSVGTRLAASHVNMLITNSVVLVPTFSSSTDAAAVAMVSSIFPDRCWHVHRPGLLQPPHYNPPTTIPHHLLQPPPPSATTLPPTMSCRKVQGLYARELVLGGGNIHCLSQQEPLA
jgi:agmatine deiminase